MAVDRAAVSGSSEHRVELRLVTNQDLPGHESSNSAERPDVIRHIRRPSNGTETRWMSLRDVARAAGVSRQAVSRWVATGRLQAISTAAGYRVAADDVERLLALRRTAAQIGVHPRTVQRWMAKSTDQGARN